MSNGYDITGLWKCPDLGVIMRISWYGKKRSIGFIGARVRIVSTDPGIFSATVFKKTVHNFLFYSVLPKRAVCLKLYFFEILNSNRWNDIEAGDVLSATVMLAPISPINQEILLHHG
jgi:hypothetical protein